MELNELVVNIVFVVCFVMMFLSGMFITHLIYEQEEHSFFEKWFTGFYMSYHLIPLFFYNYYNQKIDLKVPLWIFRISLVLVIGISVLKAKLAI